MISLVYFIATPEPCPAACALVRSRNSCTGGMAWDTERQACCSRCRISVQESTSLSMLAMTEVTERSICGRVYH